MPSDITDAEARLRKLAARWAGRVVSERAAFQGWLIEFCDALGVDRPLPPTPDYQFELPVKVIEKDGEDATNYIDCWKAGHFALEAKATDVSEENDGPLRRAYGQVRNYVTQLPGTAPAFLMTVDVPRTLMVWEGWNRDWGGFPAGRRIPLATLHERPDDIRLLQDIWTNPAARDPRGKAQQVSREIAAKLAELSAALEGRGHDSQQVARFLMRCVFCFFAEDVELLPRGLFQKTLETARTAGGPDRVAKVLSNLWQTMDQGGNFGADEITRFNGHFFQTVDALPLEPADVSLLIEAAVFDWSRVEPSIFGTLLVRALDPTERHRLGAEYTPREYIERLVEPTVVEPLRERWTAVQAAVLQLTTIEGKRPTKIKKDREEAVKELLNYHAWLRGLRFLDPACGSGNFLYVTMAAVKRIELEVIRELERVGRIERLRSNKRTIDHRDQIGHVLDEVHPRQFHGIEVNKWAREIAELTLWIGYHQFWRETHRGRTPPEPILEDTGTIECRDAVLAWDEKVHRPEMDRPDPTPRNVHAVTGDLVPDPDARLQYDEYVGARQAHWPNADFIVGNPPYLGKGRQIGALGLGYVTALRAAYPQIDDAWDFVSYWWYRAALAVGRGATARAGLITTSSITQGQQRGVIALGRHHGAEVIWAIPDHPWADDPDAAAVRVSMTVLQAHHASNRYRLGAMRGADLITVAEVPRINDDLTSKADIASAAQIPLAANLAMSFHGCLLNGKGFILSAEEVVALYSALPPEDVIKPYADGSDLSGRGQSRFVIDFAFSSEADARLAPVAFDAVRSRIKPFRDANRRKAYRDLWWRFAEPQRRMRESIQDLARYIATPETTATRVFQFVRSDTVPDYMLIVIASDDAGLLGLLSSTHHVTWTRAAGGTLGNVRRYNNVYCFAPFPFPDPNPDQRERISAVAERLDAHRKAAIARDERVTMTGMYNVVEKLRADRALTPNERAIHDVAACGVLKDLHQELDALVAEAYGWSWPMEGEEILERLVALHAQRVTEEQAGTVRWLRPEYQIPRHGDGITGQTEVELQEEAVNAPAEAARAPWPAGAVDQLAAVKVAAGRVGPNPSSVLRAFEAPDEALLRRHLETLVGMGEV